MPEIFEINPDALLQLNIKGHSSLQARTHDKVDKQLKKAMRINSLVKFHKLAQIINVNAFSSYSIHVALLLYAKIRQKREAIDVFNHATHNTAAATLDWDKIQDQPEILTDTFCSMQDWLHILHYMQLDLTDDALTAIETESCVVRMKHSLEKGGLQTYVSITTKLVLQILLYIIPANIQATKMLEKVLLLQQIQCPDLEFRCLKCMTAYMDVQVDEKKVFDGILSILPCFGILPTFFADIKTVLLKDASEEAPTCAKSNRLQMRFVTTERNAGLQYQNTYETWLAEQKFTVSMSKHLQLLLYFIHVQQQDIDMNDYHHLFPGNMFTNCNQIKIDAIDLKAVMSIIKSMRVYLHNVSALLDFRVRCLVGLNRTTRNNLSMAQVLQLYTAAYQHESIAQDCWRQIVPVWNHTTSSALKQFTSSHAFEVKAILDTVLHCQINDQGS